MNREKKKEKERERKKKESSKSIYLSILHFSNFARKIRETLFNDGTRQIKQAYHCEDIFLVEAKFYLHLVNFKSEPVARPPLFTIGNLRYAFSITSLSLSLFSPSSLRICRWVHSVRCYQEKYFLMKEKRQV